MSYEPTPPLVPSVSGYEQTSASSGQKRRRDGSPAKQSNRFTDATRNALSRRCNLEVCWNCGTPGTEIAHVVARSDPEFEQLQTKGVFSFDALSDYRNAIPICPTCHHYFDRTSATGWVFLPKCLEWFVRFEEENWNKRMRTLEETGRWTSRRYPTEQEYEDYNRAIQAVTEPDDGLCRGGLYNSYILQDMFPTMMMRTLREQGHVVPFIFPPGPRRWHGSPMAAIMRGMVVLGTLSNRLPYAELNILRELQDLYSRELPQHDSAGSERHREASMMVPGRNDSRTGDHSRQQRPEDERGSSAGSTTTCPTGSIEQRSLEHQAHSDQADSAIDVCSQDEPHSKRRRADYDTCPVQSHKRQRLSVEEEQTWISVEQWDAWNYGPGSTSEGKIKMLYGSRYSSG